MNTPHALVERLRAYQVWSQGDQGQDIYEHPEICDEAADRIEALEAALVRIALRDRHGRRVKPMEDGAFRGVGGMIATFALTGTNGSYVLDEEILAQYPKIATALSEPNHE